MSYIKLDRKITEWEWFTDGNTLKLWIYLLATAQYKDTKFKGIEIKRGQVITGRKKLAEQLGMTERQIRSCLQHLEKTQEVTIKATNRYTLITIVKYDFYQGGGDDSDQQSDQQATNKRPTNDHNTRNKERKKERRYIYNPSSNQKMTEEQENKLLLLMKGEA
jgi:biotin operon repressor